MPLNRARRAAKGLSEGLHLWPAQTRFIISVVGEGAVGWDRLCRDAGIYEVAHLGYTGKFGLRWHSRLLVPVRRVRSGDPRDDKIHQSGGSRQKDQPRRFFYALVR